MWIVLSFDLRFHDLVLSSLCDRFIVSIIENSLLFIKNHRNWWWVFIAQYCVSSILFSLCAVLYSYSLSTDPCSFLIHLILCEAESSHASTQLFWLSAVTIHSSLIESSCGLSAIIWSISKLDQIVLLFGLFNVEFIIIV